MVEVQKTTKVQRFSSQFLLGIILGFKIGKYEQNVYGHICKQVKFLVQFAKDK